MNVTVTNRLTTYTLNSADLAQFAKELGQNHKILAEIIERLVAVENPTADEQRMVDQFYRLRNDFMIASDVIGAVAGYDTVRPEFGAALLSAFRPAAADECAPNGIARPEVG